MEMTREELLQVGDAEVDSTTDYEDSPKKPPKKQQQQQKKARVDAALQHAREIFRKQNLSDSDLDSDTEQELLGKHLHKSSLLEKKLESGRCMGL